MTRYVIAIEPLATMPAEAVAAAVAPTIQRYLLGPLTPRDRYRRHGVAHLARRLDRGSGLDREALEERRREPPGADEVSIDAAIKVGGGGSDALG